MRLTIPHVVDFGTDGAIVGDDLLGADAWDALRLRTTGAYAIPADRDALDNAWREHPGIPPRAEALDVWLNGRGFMSVASYGAGSALLELALQTLSPDRL